MSSFQPVDTKLDASANALFLTLDDGVGSSSGVVGSSGGAFRSLGAAAYDSARDSSAPFFSSDLHGEVFRSVGAEGSHGGGSLAMPSFGAGGFGVARHIQRSDFGAASDDEAASSSADDQLASPWNQPSAMAIPQLKSLSLPSVVAGAVAIDEAPAYFERHSSFLTAATPHDVMLAIAQQLEMNAIEFTYSPTKLKIRGVVLANAIAANFVVRVFRQSSASAYLVEFQRRSGSVVVFTNFYRAMTQALSHLIMGKAQAAPAVATASVPFQVTLLACEPLPVAPVASSSSSSAANADCSVVLDETSFAALSEMASSQDAVCAAEALRVLGRAVAGSAVNQQFVAAHRDRSARTVSTLSRAVRSPNAYLQMLAVRLVTALVAATAVAADSAVRAALLQLLPAALVSVTSSDPLRRETARLVRAVQPSALSSASTSASIDKLSLPALKSSAPAAPSAVSAGKQLPSVLPAYGAASSALTLADVDSAFAARHGGAF